MNGLARNIDTNDLPQVTRRPEDSAKRPEPSSPAAVLAAQSYDLAKQIGQQLSGNPYGREILDQLVEDAKGQLEQPVDPALENAIGTFHAAADAGTLGPLPLSFQGLFYQAMAQLTAFDIEQLQKFLDFLKSAAEAMGGINANGQVILNSDGSLQGGLMKQQLDLSYSSAEDAGQATRLQARGSYGQAIAGGVGLGLGAVAFVKTGTSSEETEQNNYSNFQKTKLNSQPQAGLQLRPEVDLKAESISEQKEVAAGTRPANETPATDELKKRQAIQDRMKLIANNKPELKKFISDLNANDPSANEVLEHLKLNTNQDLFDKVSTNTNSLIDGMTNQIAQKNQKFTNASTWIGQISNASGQGASGYYTEQKASKDVDTAQESAQAETMKTVNQQVYTATITNTQTKATGFGDDANATAAQYAQLKA